jgi:UPF0042 nucleotide-binding protein
MTVDLTTFGYKCRAPDDFDLVFDVRDLPNPFYEPELRPLNGRDAAIAEYFASKPEVESTVRSLAGAILQAAEHPHAASPLRIAVGCTGGQHRSVYVAERVAALLRDAGLDVTIAHRELAVS